MKKKEGGGNQERGDERGGEREEMEKNRATKIRIKGKMGGRNKKKWNKLYSMRKR